MYLYRLICSFLNYQAEKEEQAAIQHAEEQPASQYPVTEWGGAADQQTGEVSNTIILCQRGQCNKWTRFTLDFVVLVISFHGGFV